MGGRGPGRGFRPGLVLLAIIGLPGGLAAPAALAGVRRADPRDAPAWTAPRPPPRVSVGAELLSEGFEDPGFPPAGWTYAPVAPAPHRWLRTTESANVYAGDGAAEIRWSDTTAPDERLLPPPLDLTTAPGNLVLSFWYRTDPFWFTEGSNGFTAGVSTDAGQSWQGLFSVHEVTEAGWAWRNGIADLSGLVGLTDVRIRFRYWGLGAADVALDEIRIGASGGGAPGNDTCAGAISGGFRIGPAPGTVQVPGDNRLAAHDYPLSAAGCTGFAHTGRDLVWIVEVPADHRFEAVMDAAGDWDDTLFLVGDCADPEGTCVDGDRGFPDGATVSWINGTGATRELRLVASGHRSAAGEFTITATIEPQVSIERVGWGRVKANWREGTSSGGRAAGRGAGGAR